MKKLITPGSLAFAEMTLLFAAASWSQSLTGTAFLHAHPALLDSVEALYVGWRAADRIRRALPNPTPPGAPGEPKNQ